MTVLTITVTTTPGNGKTLRAERSELCYCLDLIKQQLGSGAATSGTILDRDKNNVGTWTYTPSFAS